jgi:hypothetical protein
MKKNITLVIFVSALAFAVTVVQAARPAPSVAQLRAERSERLRALQAGVLPVSTTDLPAVRVDAGSRFSDADAYGQHLQAKLEGFDHDATKLVDGYSRTMAEKEVVEDAERAVEERIASVKGDAKTIGYEHQAVIKKIDDKSLKKRGLEEQIARLQKRIDVARMRRVSCMPFLTKKPSREELADTANLDQITKVALPKETEKITALQRRADELRASAQAASDTIKGLEKASREQALTKFQLDRLTEKQELEMAILAQRAQKTNAKRSALELSFNRRSIKKQSKALDAKINSLWRQIGTFYTLSSDGYATSFVLPRAITKEQLSQIKPLVKSYLRAIEQQYELSAKTQGKLIEDVEIDGKPLSQKREEINRQLFVPLYAAEKRLKPAIRVSNKQVGAVKEAGVSSHKLQETIRVLSEPLRYEGSLPDSDAPMVKAHEGDDLVEFAKLPTEELMQADITKRETSQRAMTPMTLLQQERIARKIRAAQVDRERAAGEEEVLGLQEKAAADSDGLPEAKPPMRPRSRSIS